MGLGTHFFLGQSARSICPPRTRNGGTKRIKRGSHFGLSTRQTSFISDNFYELTEETRTQQSQQTRKNKEKERKKKKIGGLGAERLTPLTR